MKSNYLPFHWDLNNFRGCQHHCHYCYAIYSHKYLDSDNYFDEIFVKTNITKCLDKDLSSKKWDCGVINIGGVCDAYQPLEDKYKLMRGVLKVLIKHKAPVTISTKSKLILRDLDLISKLADLTYVNIATTITTIDEDIRKVIEPFASPSRERFKILKEFRKTNAGIGLHIMPIIPFITDNEDNMDQLISTASKIGVDYILYVVLRLRGETKTHFFNFINSEYPELLDDYTELYKGNSLPDKSYKADLYSRVEMIKRRYNISNNYKKVLKEKMPKRPIVKTIDSWF
ncbi:MAG: radical SAM protein [Promethearchaeota archaeon]